MQMLIWKVALLVSFGCGRTNQVYTEDEPISRKEGYDDEIYIGYDDEIYLEPATAGKKERGFDGMLVNKDKASVQT